MLTMITNFLYGIFEGFWRRWFGGGFEDKLGDNRFVQHIIGFIVGFIVLLSNYYGFIQSLLAMFAFQGLYWAIGHGPAFDMSRDGYPDDEMIKRYKKYFWNKWCEFLVPKDSWYGFGYDFLWMLFRYELPAILISIILGNYWFLTAGFVTTLIYAICWSLSDREELKRLGPTSLAEILTGFFSGLLLVI